MSKLHLKVKAIRQLRRLTQEFTAEQSHMNIKTFQRKESGEPPLSIQDLEQLCVPFSCTVDDIRNFDLERNGFAENNQAYVRELELENKFLKEEREHLRAMIEQLNASFQALLNREEGAK